ncbi:MAG: virulence factor family protein [Chthoniobacteraceae bacterium]|nr:virulence factor family protein [Chthoniobacteraceae bacterium]
MNLKLKALKLNIDSARGKPSLGWCDRVFMRSVNRHIYSSAAFVGIATSATKIVGMTKEILVAAFFGMSGDLDAYLLAVLLPTYIINVITGSIDASFIPVYIQVRENLGIQAAQRLFCEVLIITTLALVIASMVMATTVPSALSLAYSQYPANRIELILGLFYLTLPCIVLTGLCGICEAVLNASEKFIFTALAPCIVPVMTIASLLLFGSRAGIYSIALGVISGLVAHLLILTYAVISRSIKMTLMPHLRDPAIIRVSRQYFPTMAASAMMCSTALIDQSMASMLVAGSVSALNFGNKIVAFVLTIETAAIGTVVLPYFSRLAATSDWSALKRTLITYVKLILLTTIPITIIGMMFSEKLVALLFERGKFGSDDTARVAWVQMMFFIQIPFYSVSILMVKLISSLQANKILLWGTIISVSLNILLNFILAKSMGAAGIALSTSVVYAVSALYLTIMARKALEQLSIK